MEIGDLIKIKEEFEYQNDSKWTGLLGIIVNTYSFSPTARTYRVRIEWIGGGCQAWHNSETLEVINESR
jgi:hypothetical protein